MTHVSYPEKQLFKQSSLFDVPSIFEPTPNGSQISHQQLNTQTAVANSLDFEIIANKTHQDSNYEISKVLLFKGIPEDLTEIEILTLCQPFGIIKDVFIKRAKHYAFLQFERVEQAQMCFEAFGKFPPNVRGHNLHVLCTGKDKVTKAAGLIYPPSRFLFLSFTKFSFPIDANMIAKLLSPYGNCLKVFLFPSKTLQFFVEMEDVLQAIYIKENLDGQLVFNSAQINITYTEEKDVFQHTKVASMTPIALNSNHALERQSTMDTNPTKSSSYKVLSWNDAPGNNPSPCIAWPNPGPSFNQSNGNNNTLFNSAFNMNSAPNNMNNINNFNAAPQFRPKPMTRPSSLTHEKTLTYPPKENTLKTMTSVSPLFHVKEEKSPTILLLKNLPKGITARQLFRLFGMYGNVLKVKIFFKNPENALVEYQTPEHAELAKSFLNNCPVYGNNIFVTNSKDGVEIDTSGLKKGEETQFMGDFLTSPEHRYKFTGSKNHLNIVPPSKVVHLSNLCEDKDESYYADLFKDFAFVKKFMFMKGPEKMALMEVGTVEEAVKVLMNFHNLNIEGKYLKVSFSKYQKIKDM